jgi:hypothetical protein
MRTRRRGAGGSARKESDPGTTKAAKPAATTARAQPGLHWIGRLAFPGAETKTRWLPRTSGARVMRGALFAAAELGVAPLVQAAENHEPCPAILVESGNEKEARQVIGVGGSSTVVFYSSAVAARKGVRAVVDSRPTTDPCGPSLSAGRTRQPWCSRYAMIMIMVAEAFTVIIPRPSEIKDTVSLRGGVHNRRGRGFSLHFL